MSLEPEDLPISTHQNSTGDRRCCGCFPHDCQELNDPLISIVKGFSITKKHEPLEAPRKPWEAINPLKAK